ncbi:MAG: hypothetical protein JST69_12180 [Bacteroidetes bacterium]|nr:hypothetical protein [Bacteroidota bacterium]
MKLLEKITFALSLIGIMLKLLLVRSGNPVLIIGASLLSCIYFYLGFALINGIGFRAMFKKASYAAIRGIRIVAGIGIGLFLSIVVIGSLFKLQIWMGSIEMMAIGSTGLLITVLAASVVFLVKRKSLDLFYRAIFLRGAIAFIFALIIFAIPSRSLIRIYHRDNPAYAELMIKALENPQDKEIQDEFDKAIERQNR